MGNKSQVDLARLGSKLVGSVEILGTCLSEKQQPHAVGLVTADKPSKSNLFRARDFV